MKRVFVYGWYGHKNLGDEAFKDSFKDLWGSKCELCFGDEIPSFINERFDVCWIGGGSFLDQPIGKLDTVQIPLGFIGVGVHAIHPKNQAAINRAEIIVSRNPLAFEIPKAIEGADLVFARDFPAYDRSSPRPRKIVTILVNAFIMERDPTWKRDAYQNFLRHFPPVCDEWIRRGYEIHFYPMCQDLIHDDRLLAFKILTEMKTFDSKANNVIIEGDEINLHECIFQSELVVSMRYHGFIYSTIAGTPFIGLNSHDKMRSYFEALGSKSFMDYYGINPESFTSYSQSLDSSEKLLEFARKEKQKWLSISDIVGEKFAL